MTKAAHPAFALLLSLAAMPAWAAPPAAAVVERDSAGVQVLRWTSTDPVDVFQAFDPNAPVKSARLVSARDGDGTEMVPMPGAVSGTVTGEKRAYFTLRNARTGEVTRLAERVLPLEGGSNFRDIGGYPAAGGKHVRWGLIYRSGATALLTTADLARVGALGLTSVIDLRSNEERVIAPSRVDGVPYATVGYSMTALRFSGGMEAGYRQFPAFLAPQLRLIFATLLRGEGPIAYNCSAGQDRTGFATAMVLTALGTPRDVILADYHLSTTYRRPANELPVITAEQAASNPVAGFFAAMQRAGNQAPQPLRTADGTAYLSLALDEIEAQWGSVDNYLSSEIGVSANDIKRLRALYTL